MFDNLFASEYRWVWLAVAVLVVLLVLEVVMRVITRRYGTPQTGYRHRGSQSVRR